MLFCNFFVTHKGYGEQPHIYPETMTPLTTRLPLNSDYQNLLPPSSEPFSHSHKIVIQIHDPATVANHPFTTFAGPRTIEKT